MHVCSHVSYICCWLPNIPISAVSIKPLIKQVLCSVCYWAQLSVEGKFEAIHVPCCNKINQSINQSIYLSIYLSIYISIYLSIYLSNVLDQCVMFTADSFCSYTAYFNSWCHLRGNKCWSLATYLTQALICLHCKASVITVENNACRFFPCKF